MPVAETSKAAYKKVKLGPKQLRVYNALKKLGKATDLELSDYLGEEINEVVPRRFELVQYGYIIQEGRKLNRTGNTAKLWTWTTPEDGIIKRIFGKRLASKEVVDCE